jgi:hypothetical protein
MSGRIARQRTSTVALLGLVAMSAACFLPPGSSSSTMAPTTAATSETFAGTLAVQGSSTYVFTVSQAGAVSITLSSVGPPSVAVRLGIGTTNGTICTVFSAIPSALPSSTPQITITENPGTFCVDVADVGNLTGPTPFSVIIAHS